MTIATDIACVDLFCGAGGLTHGLVGVGINVKVGVDFDEACRFAYEANHPGITFHCGDVAKLDAETVRAWFGNATIRVLVGCAPCQPFSTYALRYQKEQDGNREKDERWGLLSHFERLVSNALPDVVAMENVPSVVKHSVFSNFVLALKNHGYFTWVNIIDCAKYGLPQKRRRTILLASRYGEISLLPPKNTRERTVKDAIGSLPALGHGEECEEDRLHVAASLSERNLKRIRLSKQSGTWRDWPKALRLDCHKKKTGKTYSGVYGRMAYDEPAPTLTTQFYGFGNGRFGHPIQDRAISLREGALLQGFPRSYQFVPEGAKIEFRTLGRMIGNAVPVDLGRVIGESILAHVARFLSLLFLLVWRKPRTDPCYLSRPRNEVLFTDGCQSHAILVAKFYGNQVVFWLSFPHVKSKIFFFWLVIWVGKAFDQGGSYLRNLHRSACFGVQANESRVSLVLRKRRANTRYFPRPSNEVSLADVYRNHALFVAKLYRDKLGF